MQPMSRSMHSDGNGTSSLQNIAYTHCTDNATFKQLVITASCQPQAQALSLLSGLLQMPEALHASGAHRNGSARCC